MAGVYSYGAAQPQAMVYQQPQQPIVVSPQQPVVYQAPAQQPMVYQVPAPQACTCVTPPQVTQGASVQFPPVPNNYAYAAQPVYARQACAPRQFVNPVVYAATPQIPVVKPSSKCCGGCCN